MYILGTKKQGEQSKKKPFSFFLEYIYNNYLFDQDGFFLAFLKPGFFLSLILASLLSKPYGFKVTLNSASQSISALAIANLIASACPLRPPHDIVTAISNCWRYVPPNTSNAINAASNICLLPPKYCSTVSSLPFDLTTVITPFP